MAHASGGTLSSTGHAAGLILAGIFAVAVIGKNSAQLPMSAWAARRSR
jgi:hypothetical protein